VFSRKGGPFCESWFSQLPPGLDQGDVDTATWITGDTDRITCDKFLDLLAHRILPEHRAKVGPSGKLFWWVDGPTAHGLTQDYKLREDIAMFAVKNNICLIYFPHNATHKMQPNDQVVHLLLKMGMAEILRKARESWGNIHYYICQKDLVAAKPTVSRKHTRKGLLSAGDGSLRDPSMRSSQYRAAHFHTGDSRSKFSFTQRDHIIAAMWVWKNSITEEAVKISWAVCFLIPFNPRGHEVYSARAERAKAELEKTVPQALEVLEARRREFASPVFVDKVNTPAAATRPDCISDRKAAAIMKKQNDASADACLTEVLQKSKNMCGVARGRMVMEELRRFLNRLDSQDVNMDLISGSGAVAYAPITAITFDEDAAKAARSQAGRGVPAGLTNLLPGTDNLRCGLVFSGDEVRQQAAEVRLTSNANIAVLEGRVTSKQKRLGKAAENTKKHTAALTEARVASDRAIAEVERAEAAIANVGVTTTVASSGIDSHSSHSSHSSGGSSGGSTNRGKKRSAPPATELTSHSSSTGQEKLKQARKIMATAAKALIAATKKVNQSQAAVSVAADELSYARKQRAIAKTKQRKRLFAQARVGPRAVAAGRRRDTVA